MYKSFLYLWNIYFCVLIHHNNMNLPWKISPSWFRRTSVRVTFAWGQCCKRTFLNTTKEDKVQWWCSVFYHLNRIQLCVPELDDMIKIKGFSAQETSKQISNFRDPTQKPRMEIRCFGIVFLKHPFSSLIQLFVYVRYIHLNSSGKSSSTEIFPPFVEHVMPKGRKQDVKPYCTVI